MKVAKWGNSLAVRLPASLVVELGLKEGDEIELHTSGGRQFEVSVENSRQQRIARMRALSVPMPADFKFDREEANLRGDRESRYWDTDKDNAQGSGNDSGDQGAAAD